MSKRVIISGGIDNLKSTITQMVAIAQLLEQLSFSGGTNGYNQLSPPRNKHPLIRLKFVEDKDKIPQGRDYPYRGQISFRLMDETYKSITEGNLKTLGYKIRDTFGAAPGYVWDKGREMYSYTDWDDGYQFQLLARTEAEAKRLVTDVLSLREHTPDWERFNSIVNGAPDTRYPSQPPSELILGETRQLPRLRPLVEVRFAYAESEIYGVGEPVIIYDRTGLQFNPLVDDTTPTPNAN